MRQYRGVLWRRYFIAFGAVLLIDAFLKENGIQGIELLHIGLWAILTAIAALIIHMTRLLRLDAASVVT